MGSIRMGIYHSQPIEGGIKHGQKKCQGSCFTMPNLCVLVPMFIPLVADELHFPWYDLCSLFNISPCLFVEHVREEFP